MTHDPPAPASDAPELSLRELKRRETMAAIEDAATALVAESGYDAVTVDDICARARVSRRTFFNYVPSKEAAVVGAPATVIPDALVDDFRTAAPRDPLSATLRLLLAVNGSIRVGDSAHASTVSRRRTQIFRSEPALATARMTAFAPLHLRLTELVESVLAGHPGSRRLPDLPPEAEARAVVAVAFTATTLGLNAWLARPGAGLEELDRECLSALDRIAELVHAPLTTHTDDPRGIDA